MNCFSGHRSFWLDTETTKSPDAMRFSRNHVYLAEFSLQIGKLFAWYQLTGNHDLTATKESVHKWTLPKATVCTGFLVWFEHIDKHGCFSRIRCTELSLKAMEWVHLDWRIGLETLNTKRKNSMNQAASARLAPCQSCHEATKGQTEWWSITNWFDRCRQLCENQHICAPWHADLYDVWICHSSLPDGNWELLSILPPPVAGVLGSRHCFNGIADCEENIPTICHSRSCVLWSGTSTNRLWNHLQVSIEVKK